MTEQDDEPRIRKCPIESGCEFIGLIDDHVDWHIDPNGINCKRSGYKPKPNPTPPYKRKGQSK